MVSAEDAELHLVKVSIREAQYFPVFVGVLSVWPVDSRLAPERHGITDEELHALADRAEKIIVGAYDGEGYLIWAKLQAPA